jgi:hypothetical protein
MTGVVGEPSETTSTSGSLAACVCVGAIKVAANSDMTVANLIEKRLE